MQPLFNELKTFKVDSRSCKSLFTVNEIHYSKQSFSIVKKVY